MVGVEAWASTRVASCTSWGIRHDTTASNGGAIVGVDQRAADGAPLQERPMRRGRMLGPTEAGDRLSVRLGPR